MSDVLRVDIIGGQPLPGLFVHIKSTSLCVFISRMVLGFQFSET